MNIRIQHLSEGQDTELPPTEQREVKGTSRDEMSSENTEVTAVHPSDTIGMFTLEQVLLFPDAVKERIVYGNRTAPEGHFDCALVLGGPVEILQSRAAAAAKLYHTGQVSLLMVSGGVCRQTELGCLSEAQALTRYLLEAGVPAEQIVIEDEATTTMENMQKCLTLLEQRFGTRALRLVVVSSNFHINRAVMLAKFFLPGHEILGLGAEYPKDNAREYLSDPLLRQWVTKECRCFWNCVQNGWFRDFPV